jgi:hypothetical protein
MSSTKRKAPDEYEIDEQTVSFALLVHCTSTDLPSVARVPIHLSDYRGRILLIMLPRLRHTYALHVTNPFPLDKIFNNMVKLRKQTMLVA